MPMPELIEDFLAKTKADGFGLFEQLPIQAMVGFLAPDLLKACLPVDMAMDEAFRVEFAQMIRRAELMALARVGTNNDFTTAFLDALSAEMQA